MDGSFWVLAAGGALFGSLFLDIVHVSALVWDRLCAPVLRGVDGFLSVFFQDVILGSIRDERPRAGPHLAAHTLLWAAATVSLIGGALFVAGTAYPYTVMAAIASFLLK